MAVSSFSNGAPATPETQHSPLHLERLHAKSFSIMSSDTMVFPY